MKKVFLALTLALAISGCAQLTNGYNALTGAVVSPTAVIIAANAFDGVEATATNYLRLAKCTATTTVICRSSAATKVIIPAVRSGRTARNNLEAFMVANPGALGPTGLYNALVTATATLQQTFAQFGIQ